MSASDEALTFTEWRSESLSSNDIAEVRTAIGGLREVLKPRFSQFRLQPDGRVALGNLLGSTGLPSGRALRVDPPHTTNERWPDAIVQLLNANTRIAVSSSRRSSHSPPRSDLTTAVAAEYANRLQSALAASGPIEAYQRERLTLRRLRGHLRVSDWVRTSVLHPNHFPIERDSFTTSNDFSRALAKVADLLAVSSRQASIAMRLRGIERQLLPGAPSPTNLNPFIANKPLPPQWRHYQPAWDIAAAILKNRSVVGDPGTIHGLEVAVEPWPLLETLLERTLTALAKRSDGLYQVAEKTTHSLISDSRTNAGQSVIPDGLLMRSPGVPTISFEAKYTSDSAKPDRDHTFQTLATAGSLRTAIAVLVYPGDQEPCVYDVSGFSAGPRFLVTIGLSLFTYERGAGDHTRAQRLEAVLADLYLRLMRTPSDPERF